MSNSQKIDIRQVGKQMDRQKDTRQHNISIYKDIKWIDRQIDRQIDTYYMDRYIDRKKCRQIERYYLTRYYQIYRYYIDSDIDYYLTRQIDTRYINRLLERQIYTKQRGINQIDRYILDIKVYTRQYRQIDRNLNKYMNNNIQNLTDNSILYKTLQITFNSQNLKKNIHNTQPQGRVEPWGIRGICP